MLCRMVRIFILPSGAAITLAGNLPGIWIGSAGYNEQLTATINQDSEFTFVANDSQRATVRVFVNQESHVAGITSDNVLDEDENRQWFAPATLSLSGPNTRRRTVRSTLTGLSTTTKMAC